MNDTLALLLVGLLLFIAQCKYDHRDRDLAALARRNTWLAWQAMHPELFIPGSKGDRLNRAFFASNQPPTRSRRILWPNLARYHFPLPKSPSPS